MKKLFMMAMMIAASVGLTNAQTTQRQIVEEGGTGPFKSEVVGDASCPGFTVYRPQNLKEVVAKQGCLPVIVYANGACFNNNVEMRLLLSEVASYGYVAAAIGPYDEADVMAQWRGVLKAAYPETGTTFPDLSQDAVGSAGLVDRPECRCAIRILSLSGS